VTEVIDGIRYNVGLRTVLARCPPP
jgi:hypothetical protein